jgi:hypothetical protein
MRCSMLSLLLLASCNAKSTAWDAEMSDATGCKSGSSSSQEPDFVCWDGDDGVNCFYGPTSFSDCMSDPLRPAMAGCH